MDWFFQGNYSKWRGREYDVNYFCLRWGPAVPRVINQLPCTRKCRKTRASDVISCQVFLWGARPMRDGSRKWGPVNHYDKLTQCVIYSLPHHFVLVKRAARRLGSAGFVSGPTRLQQAANKLPDGLSDSVWVSELHPTSPNKQSNATRSD